MFYFTADTHFNHENIIKYSKRPFDSIKEMNEVLIENWNAVIKSADIIYHLGDFAIGRIDKCENILRHLNGQIYLCVGSHDKIITHSGLRQYFKKIDKNFEIKIDNQHVFMSHYLHKIWSRSHYGSYHLCGHSHGGMNKYIETEGKIIDVGVDCNSFSPISWEQVQEIMRSRPLNFNDLERKKQ